MHNPNPRGHENKPGKEGLTMLCVLCIGQTRESMEPNLALFQRETSRPRTLKNTQWMLEPSLTLISQPIYTRVVLHFSKKCPLHFAYVWHLCTATNAWGSRLESKVLVGWASFIHPFEVVVEHPDKPICYVDLEL